MRDLRSSDLSPSKKDLFDSTDPRSRSSRLDLDGDRDYESKVPHANLYLSSSLLELELHSVQRLNTFLSLDHAIPNLHSVEIEQRGMKVASFAPFFKTQGSFLTSLVLFGENLVMSIDEDWEEEPPGWYNPLVRDGFHDNFNHILPLISLCLNLVSVANYDVHLPHLARLGHPSVEVIVLHKECTMAHLSGQDYFMDDDEYDDAFAKVSMAIQELLERSKFPPLKPIRFAGRGSTWEAILEPQSFDEYGPWGLEGRLDLLGIELVDGTGVKWTQSVAGEQYLDESSEEEEDWGEEEDEDQEGEEEGEQDDGEKVEEKE